MSIKNAPSGAVMTMPSTATDSTMLPQGSPRRKRHRADGRLHRRLGKIGKHAVKPLFRRERRSDKAKAHTHGAENERREDHADRRKAHARHIADIDRRSDEDEQNDLRRQPELAEFFREPLGNERRALHLK